MLLTLFPFASVALTIRPCESALSVALVIEVLTIILPLVCPDIDARAFSSTFRELTNVCGAIRVAVLTFALALVVFVFALVYIAVRHGENAWSVTFVAV